LAAKFYKLTRYGGKPGRDETVYVFRNGRAQIIACVRLQRRDDGWLLRAMVVEQGERGKGLGARFLDAVCEACAPEVIWCYPFRWLEGFYGHSGFRRVEAGEAPEWFDEGFRRIKQTRDVLAMVYRTK